jgi:hypothetical protein
MSYPASKFEADNALTNPVVLEKYQLAADIVNGMMRRSILLYRSTDPPFFYVQVFFLWFLPRCLPEFQFAIFVNLVMTLSKPM